MAERFLDDMRLGAAIQGMTGVGMAHPMGAGSLAADPFCCRLHNTEDLLPGEMAVLLATDKHRILRPPLIPNLDPLPKSLQVLIIHHTAVVGEGGREGQDADGRVGGQTC